VEEDLAALQYDRRLVRSFFHAPSVAYAQGLISNAYGLGPLTDMGRRLVISLVMLLVAVGSLSADELLYSYEGIVVPYDTSAGWVIYDPCEPECSESIQDGHFVLTWVGGADIANYDLTIAASGEEPPPTLWVEWRFRSNNFFTTSPSCDGQFSVRYRHILDTIYMHGDAAISFSGDFAVFGLDVNNFHTYRFESRDGLHYTFAVDGDVFVDMIDAQGLARSRLQLRGRGACAGDQVNEWDYVRFGTLSSGEGIIASDPPAGILAPHTYAGLDRFSVTFSAPNFVYIDDITAEVTGGGEPPQVVRTWRRDNDGPETLEVVLDRPIPLNETTRFVFKNGAGGTSVISYTVRGVPAASAWTLVVMALLILAAGTIVVVRRCHRLAPLPPPRPAQPRLRHTRPRGTVGLRHDATPRVPDPMSRWGDVL